MRKEARGACDAVTPTDKAPIDASAVEEKYGEGSCRQKNFMTPAELERLEQFPNQGFVRVWRDCAEIEMPTTCASDHAPRHSTRPESWTCARHEYDAFAPYPHAWQDVHRAHRNEERVIADASKRRGIIIQEHKKRHTTTHACTI